MCAFAALIVVFIGVGWIVLSSLASMNTASEDKERSLQAARKAELMMVNLLEQQNAARGFAILGTPSFYDTYQESGQAFERTVAEFKALSRAPEQHRRADQLLSEVRDLRVKLDEVVALARNPATRPKAGELSGVKMLGKIRPLLAEINKTQEQRVEQRVRAEDEAQASGETAIWIGGVLTIFLAGLLAWLLSRTVAAPVRQMTGVMNELATGNNAVQVPGTNRGDEIGSMAKAVLVFREAAIEKQKADAAKKEADAEQQLVVATLEQGLSKLAEGDLTAQIEANFSPSYATVKSNFNNALTSLRALIGSVSQSAVSIRTGSNEIAQASEDLARRTEANAASLEETSAAITQMDGRLKAGAEAANRTVERADGAISTVQDGRSIADEAVKAMGRVSESAEGIDSVIEGLDKIAFQTRVLAMNAAVEAGRAGEAGRGFAVVADLVSALAMRAEEEAGRARNQLTATQADIGSAVEMVQKVDTALANIAGDVSEVHTLLNQIAADNQAQSTAITQISAATSAMDQATQQNAAMVEETSAAARNLSGEVSALSEEASKFNTGHSSTAHGDRPAPARRAAPLPVKTKAAPMVAPVKGFALPSVANGHDDTDWNAF
jgi:methyl-accepting chemotaxis protein